MRSPRFASHFQEKWNPVSVRKCDKRKIARALAVSGQRETALERWVK
jgi:hypothetical protein